ncbi:MAG: helix-turn-helix transcriptional regulator [Treponema sp.]|nr:helix-turn-helix transcriptional regulator [Treponema sp.]
MEKRDKSFLIGQFLKDQRKLAGLSQEDFAVKSGLGLRFIRELEQGKKTVRLDKVNQALEMFGYTAMPVKISSIRSEKSAEHYGDNDE